MKKIDKLKAISKAFNGSETIDEFIVKLDLAGITLDDATKLYSEANKDLVKYMDKLWTKNGVFSFSEVLKHANCIMNGSKVHIALPYSCTMKHYKEKADQHYDGMDKAFREYSRENGEIKNAARTAKAFPRKKMTGGLDAVDKLDAQLNQGI